MQEIVSNKFLLFVFIGVLIIDTIYRPYLPHFVKKLLHNSLFKIAVITYLTIKSNYTVKFSLLVSVVVLTILEMVREIEHFEVINSENKKDFSNSLSNVILDGTMKSSVSVNNDASINTNSNALQINGIQNNMNSITSTALQTNLGLSTSEIQTEQLSTTETIINKPPPSCTANIAELTMSSKVNKDIIARIVTNYALLTPTGKCKVGTPYETILLLGTYKNVVPAEEDQHYLLPSSLISINNDEPGVVKEINIIVRQGYKLTFETSTGKKTILSATNNDNGLYNNSSEIKKALLDVVQIYVEQI